MMLPNKNRKKRMCTNKLSYRSVFNAIEGCRAACVRYNRRLHVYHCPFCRLYHVGGMKGEESDAEIAAVTEVFSTLYVRI